jgi:hypothetical protein
MKNWRAVIGSVLLLLLMAASFHQTPVQAQQGIRGPTTGLFWIPSAFQLMFGDVTSSDVYLQKNGANVLGMSGNLGGAGSTANTTTTPAGPFTWGKVTLSSNTATVTFPQAFTNVPICVATDFTTAQLVKAAPTVTTVVITDTVGASDVVQYFCVGNPN